MQFIVNEILVAKATIKWKSKIDGAVSETHGSTLPHDFTRCVGSVGGSFP